jgi:hypothetical protein
MRLPINLQISFASLRLLEFSLYFNSIYSYFAYFSKAISSSF